MKPEKDKTESDTKATTVLFVGSTQDILPRTVNVEAPGLQVCENILEAIALAARKNFDVVAVAMSSVQSKLPAALKALRSLGIPKLVLLAQMYEEPFARSLVTSNTESAPLADEYLLCPLTEKDFSEGILLREAPVEKDEIGSLREALEKKDETIKQLTRLATEDDLTGLKNRRYLREFLRQIIGRATKDDLQVTILVFDIDNFKHYNDVYGHSTGDAILKQAAVLMKRCCRDHDIVARIGGDEFAVVFWDRPNTEKPDDRRAAAEHPRQPIFIAERFRKELGSAELGLLGPRGKGLLTISGGLASFPRDGKTAEHLLEEGDKALLEAKRSGKNRIYLVGRPSEAVGEQKTNTDQAGNSVE